MSGLHMSRAGGGNLIVTDNDMTDPFGDLDMGIDDGDDQIQDVSEAAGSGEEGPEAGPLTSSQGPQPDDQGIQKSATSAVTDFTRRRNWTQRILEEMKDMLLVLSSDGRILYASPATGPVTEHDPEQLSGMFLSELVHDDDKAIFIREFNESIATGHRLRFHYRFKKPDDNYVILEASGHPHMASEKITLGTGKEGNPCNGFFLICRPYPTKNTALLDSFLEHKVENMRLSRKIADLKKEEEEELRAQQQWIRRSDNTGSASPPEDRDGNENGLTTSPDRGIMLPPAKPGVSGASQEPYHVADGTEDAVSRSDASSIIDGIEMMTGLRYSEGERSRGLSTGGPDARLIHDNSDMHLFGLSSDENDNKKRIKTSAQYVCTDCGTLESPEWRKGPSGPKTMCNACGCKFSLGGPLLIQSGADHYHSTLGEKGEEASGVQSLVGQLKDV
jgi:PAS domain S-box-containing protein